MTEGHERTKVGTAPEEHRYAAAMANRIEARWQERWRADRMFEVSNPTGVLAATGDVRSCHPRPSSRSWASSRQWVWCQGGASSPSLTRRTRLVRWRAA